MTDDCPTCGRPIVDRQRARRTCWRCKKPMGHHDKWRIGRDGRLRHRHCDFPQSYLSREDWERLRAAPPRKRARRRK